MNSHPAIKHINSGLVLARGFYRMEYQADGVRRYKSTGTADIAAAREIRDKFYATMSATVNAHPHHSPAVAKVLAGERHFVYYRKPWIAKVKKKYLGEFDTAGEAMVKVREYLEND